MYIQFLVCCHATHPTHITITFVYPKQPVYRVLLYPYAKAVRRTEFRLVSTILHGLPRVVQPVQGENDVCLEKEATHQTLPTSAPEKYLFS